MNIPSRIRITAKTDYEVFLVDHFPEADTMGSCCSDSRQILIRNDLTPRQKTITLIHEILHAMQFEYGIKIPHESVDQLDEAIERCLRLNKWL